MGWFKKSEKEDSFTCLQTGENMCPSDDSIFNCSCMEGHKQHKENNG